MYNTLPDTLLRYLASKQPKSLTQRGQTTLATRTPLTGYRRVHEARADEARGRERRQERGPRREEGGATVELQLHT